MPDMLPLTITTLLLPLLTLASLWVCGALAWAAIRNHFWRHTTRPVVIASAILFFSLAFFLGEQDVIDAFPPTVPWHWLIVRSGPVNVGALVLLAVGIGAFFFTVSIAYPDAHRGKGMPHNRTSHAD